MKRFLPTILCFALALLFSAIAVWMVGESPLNVIKILSVSAFGGYENFSYTLYYATPLLLTGSAVSLALRAGLFNIGAEGQLYMGALGAALWGAFTRNWFSPGSPSSVLAGLTLLGAFAISFAGGALWGALAGYLKTHKKVHEVIATIMLNFIALALTNWVILNVIKNPDTQNLETLPIAEQLRFAPIWKHITVGLPAAITIAAITLISIEYSWWGFRVRATGLNDLAARTAGIRTGRTMLQAMGLSGGISGLVGFHEVYCNSYRLLDSFSPGYGFMGLAIALLSGGRISTLIFSALLFGALHKGALDLDLETEKITRDLSAVIQALVLVALAAQPALTRVLSRKTEPN